mmetsp:Transcript_24408/g.84841  ORF Transcript_24408/g.84841 Transcript_24408/m.84841 type:complete len:287 (-) Transcript_24408:694-1554(-)
MDAARSTQRPPLSHSSGTSAQRIVGSSGSSTGVAVLTPRSRNSVESTVMPAPCSTRLSLPDVKPTFMFASAVIPGAAASGSVKTTANCTLRPSCSRRRSPPVRRVAVVTDRMRTDLAPFADVSAAMYVRSACSAAPEKVSMEPPIRSTSPVPTTLPSLALTDAGLTAAQRAVPVGHVPACVMLRQAPPGARQGPASPAHDGHISGSAVATLCDSTRSSSSAAAAEQSRVPGLHAPPTCTEQTPLYKHGADAGQKHWQSCVPAAHAPLEPAALHSPLAKHGADAGQS